MRLTLIRHAESFSSTQQMIADINGCTGLTERGFVQAHRLADRLRKTGELSDCTVYLTSPVLRARQTAEVLLGALPVSSFQEEPDLRDVIPGAADGLSRQEYEDRHGAFNLRAEPDRPFSPEGDSWNSFTKRVRETQQRLAKQYEGQSVVAVCHAGYIVIAILELFSIPRPGSGAWLNPTNTAITEWDYADGRWSLVRYNDASHLLEKA
jgi:probable phosphoglycerate mutase